MEHLVLFAITYKAYITIAHVLSVVMGMGGALMTDILFVTYALDKKFTKQEGFSIRLLSHVVTGGLVAICLTGGLLYLSDIDKYTASAKFATKMMVVSVLIINGIVLHKYVFSQVYSPGFLNGTRNQSLRRVAFACGAVSIISWVSAMSLGVLDAIPVSVREAMMMYSVLVLSGVIVSQLVSAIYNSTSYSSRKSEKAKH